MADLAVETVYEVETGKSPLSDNVSLTSNNDSCIVAVFGAPARVLRDRPAFRFLLGAQILSQIGDWTNEIAAVNLLTTHTTSGLAVSMFFVCRELAFLLFQPIAGVVGDMFDRRSILMAVDAVRSVIVLLFIIPVEFPQLLWSIYVVTFLQFVFSAMFSPAFSALMPQLVEQNEVTAANALGGSVFSSMLLAGAGLGGVMVYLFGPIACFVIDSASYVCSYLLLRVLRRYPLRTDDAAMPLADEIDSSEVLSAPGHGELLYAHEFEPVLLDNVGASDGAIEDLGSLESAPSTSARWNFSRGLSAFGTGFREGLRYLQDHPYYLAIVFAKATGSLTWAGADIALFRWAAPHFSSSVSQRPLTLSLIYASGGLGVAVVPFLLVRLVPDSPRSARMMIAVGSILIAVGSYLMAFTFSLWFYLFSNLVKASGGSCIWLYSSSILGTELPNNIRARCMSIQWGALTLTGIISRLVFGALLDGTSLGAPRVQIIFGMQATVVALWWVSFALWNRRREPSAAAGYERVDIWEPPISEAEKSST